MTDSQIEIMIYDTFQGNEADEIKVNKILDQIHRIDWSVYESISGNHAFELLDFLSQYISDSDMDRKLNFFKATKHLDGAYAEKYASIMGDLFLQDSKSTINIISKLEPKKYEEMIDYILYDFATEDYNNLREHIKPLMKLELTQNEKK